ncbi:MAG: acetyl-CoA carboxylase biotin carboxyl carrier protein [Gemmatimonadota bacterium]
MNISDIERLTRILRESPEVGSIEIRGWFGRGLLITRNGYTGSAPVTVHQMAAHPAAPASSGHHESREPARAPEPVAPPVTALKEIKSPMVGTFYKAPEPGAEAYVKVGSRVVAGQTVCIIEAMKIMNEIEAEISGVVREISVEDTQPVEFGTVLYRVDPNG